MNFAMLIYNYNHLDKENKPPTMHKAWWPVMGLSSVIFLRYYNSPVRLQRQVFAFYNHLLNKKISDEDNKAA